jgi:hypothetical protein
MVRLKQQLSAWVDFAGPAPLQAPMNARRAGTGPEQMFAIFVKGNTLCD